MFDKMKQLYEMQKKARELQKQLESIKLEKASTDGLVRVSVNGAQKVDNIVIDSSALTPEKKSILERTLRDLINEAFTDMQKQTASQAASFMKGFPGLGG